MILALPLSFCLMISLNVIFSCKEGGREGLLKYLQYQPTVIIPARFSAVPLRTSGFV